MLLFGSRTHRARRPARRRSSLAVAPSRLGLSPAVCPPARRADALWRLALEARGRVTEWRKGEDTAVYYINLYGSRSDRVPAYTFGRPGLKSEIAMDRRRDETLTILAVTRGEAAATSACMHVRPTAHRTLWSWLKTKR